MRVSWLKRASYLLVLLFGITDSASRTEEKIPVRTKTFFAIGSLSFWLSFAFAVIQTQVALYLNNEKTLAVCQVRERERDESRRGAFACTGKRSPRKNFQVMVNSLNIRIQIEIGFVNRTRKNAIF